MSAVEGSFNRAYGPNAFGIGAFGGLFAQVNVVQEGPVSTSLPSVSSPTQTASTLPEPPSSDGGLEEYMYRHGYIDATLADLCVGSGSPEETASAWVSELPLRDSLTSRDSAPFDWLQRSMGASGSGVDIPTLYAVVESGNRAEDKAFPPVPPQPSLPVRLPRRIPRGFDSASSTSYTSYSSGAGNSSSSRSLPGTPASLSSQSLGPSHLPGRLVEVEEEEQEVEEPEDLIDARVSGGGVSLATESHGDGAGHSGFDWSAERGAIAEKAKRASRARAFADKGGYNTAHCCLGREGRLQRSGWEAIREDQPQTAFDLDVASLELRSVLRRHSVEPSQALVGDLIQWFAFRKDDCPDDLSRTIPPKS